MKLLYSPIALYFAVHSLYSIRIEPDAMTISITNRCLIAAPPHILHASLKRLTKLASRPSP